MDSLYLWANSLIFPVSDLTGDDIERGASLKGGPDSANRPPLSIIVPVFRRECQEEVYAGSHVYPGQGVYLLKFDNSYSLWRSKKLYYRVYYTRWRSMVEDWWISQLQQESRYIHFSPVCIYLLPSNSCNLREGKKKEKNCDKIWSIRLCSLSFICFKSSWVVQLKWYFSVVLWACIMSMYGNVALKMHVLIVII